MSCRRKCGCYSVRKRYSSSLRELMRGRHQEGLSWSWKSRRICRRLLGLDMGISWDWSGVVWGPLTRCESNGEVKEKEEEVLPRCSCHYRYIMVLYMRSTICVSTEVPYHPGALESMACAQSLNSSELLQASTSVAPLTSLHSTMAVRYWTPCASAGKRYG